MKSDFIIVLIMFIIKLIMFIIKWINDKDIEFIIDNYYFNEIIIISTN